MKPLAFLICLTLAITCCKSTKEIDVEEKEDKSVGEIWKNTTTISDELFTFKVPIIWEDMSKLWMGCRYCPRHFFYNNGLGFSCDDRGKQIFARASVLKLENTTNFQQDIQMILKRLPKKSKLIDRKRTYLNDGSEAVFMSLRLKHSTRDHNYYNSTYLFITHSKKYCATCVMTIYINHADEIALNKAQNLMPYTRNFFQTFRWRELD